MKKKGSEGLGMGDRQGSLNGFFSVIGRSHLNLPSRSYHSEDSTTSIKNPKSGSKIIHQLRTVSKRKKNWHYQRIKRGFMCHFIRHHLLVEREGGYIGPELEREKEKKEGSGSQTASNPYVQKRKEIGKKEGFSQNQKIALRGSLLLIAC